MPLDNADFIPDDYQKLLHVARKLRDGDFDFPWDYTGCNTCAIAIGKVILGMESRENYFGLSSAEFCQIFIEVGSTSGKGMRAVQPEDVAEVIEQVVEAKVYA